MKTTRSFPWGITACPPAVTTMKCLGSRDGDTLNSKYAFVCHAELNAILNYSGGSLKGTRIYSTLFPCNECAKAIIQSGIREVIYLSDKYADTDGVRASKRMFDLVGIKYREYVPAGQTVTLHL